MRKNFRFSVAAILAASIVSFPACQDDYDDEINGLRQDVDKNTEAIASLTATVSTLESAINSGKLISNVAAVTNSTTGATGWKLTFTDNTSSEIWNGLNGVNGADGTNGTNGIDGTNGVTPFVSIDKDGFWCVDYQDGKGTIAITDPKGNKISAKGANGTNGNNGITPQFKIENGRWMVSTDEGATWKDAGQATGNGTNGKDGNSIAVQVSDDGYYQFAVYNGKDEDTGNLNVLETIKTPYPANPNAIISSVVVNEFTATFNINSYDAESNEYEAMSFEVPLASGKDQVALTNIVLLQEEMTILEGGKAVLPFKVVPSNASINNQNFALEYVATYSTRSEIAAPYTIEKVEGVEGKTGYFNATIKTNKTQENDDNFDTEDAIFLVYKNIKSENEEVETISEITSTIPVKITSNKYTAITEDNVSEFLADPVEGEEYIAPAIYANKSCEASLILLDYEKENLNINDIAISFTDNLAKVKEGSLKFGDTQTSTDKNGEAINNSDIIVFTIEPNQEAVNALENDPTITVTATITDKIGNKVIRTMQLPIKRIAAQSATLEPYNTWISPVQNKTEVVVVDYLNAEAYTDNTAETFVNFWKEVQALIIANPTTYSMDNNITVVKVDGETGEESSVNWTTTSDLKNDASTLNISVEIPAIAEAGTYKLTFEPYVSDKNNENNIIFSFTVTKEIVIKSPEFRLQAKEGITFDNEGFYTAYVSSKDKKITFADLFNIINVSDPEAPAYFDNNADLSNFVKYKYQIDEQAEIDNATDVTVGENIYKNKDAESGVINVTASISLPNGQSAPIDIIAADADRMNPEQFVSENGSFKARFVALTIESLTLEKTEFNYDGINSETISLSKATAMGNNGEKFAYVDEEGFKNIVKFQLTAESVNGLTNPLVTVEDTEGMQVVMNTVTGASWTYGTTKTQTVKATVTDAWEQTTELSFDLIFTSTIK